MHNARLHSLDALRTIASIAVAIEHWPQHFFWIERFKQPLISSPFFYCLSDIYIYGASAVTFFFCLSGFVFYWLYSENIHAGEMSFLHFSGLRLSRLYPLHFLTLILMVLLTFVSRKILDFNWIYHENNDLDSFLLNVLLVQYWGFIEGYSWNSPSWSISVEIALYIIFFVSCVKLRPSILQALLFVVTTLALAKFSIITSAAVAFFCGGVTYYLLSFSARYHSGKMALVAVFLTILIWLLLARLVNKDEVAPIVEAVKNSMPNTMLGNLASRSLEVFCGRVREFVLFPTLIFTAAFLEICTPNLGWSRMAGIGNISFGVYLLHFPLQLAAASIALWYSIPNDTFARPSTFIVFVVALLFVAVCSYYWFERPVMVAIRKKWAGVTEW